MLYDPDRLARTSIPESGSGKWSVWESVGGIAVQIETAVHPTLLQLCSAFAAACRVD